VPVFAEPGWFPEDSVEVLIATVRELDMVAVRATFPEPVTGP
jgi:thioredoxin 1